MDTLPVEIIVLIVDTLASDHPVSNLDSLQRTSKFFRDLCLPFVHRSVTLCAQPSGPPLARAMRYFTLHPNTRRLVHTLCIRGEAFTARPFRRNFSLPYLVKLANYFLNCSSVVLAEAVLGSKTSTPPRAVACSRVTTMVIYAVKFTAHCSIHDFLRAFPGIYTLTLYFSLLDAHSDTTLSRPPVILPISITTLLIRHCRVANVRDAQYLVDCAADHLTALTVELFPVPGGDPFVPNTTIVSPAGASKLRDFTCVLPIRLCAHPLYGRDAAVRARLSVDACPPSTTHITIEFDCAGLSRFADFVIARFPIDIILHHVASRSPVPSVALAIREDFDGYGPTWEQVFALTPNTWGAFALKPPFPVTWARVPTTMASNPLAAESMTIVPS